MKREQKSNIGKILTNVAFPFIVNRTVLGSNLGRDTEECWGVPEYFKEMPGQYLKLGQDHFFPNNFEFIIHQSPSHTHSQRRKKGHRND
jgi:hypothetical protein